MFADVKLKIAEYLAGLDPAMAGIFCAQQDLDSETITPHVFENGQDVYDCLDLFMKNGVPLAPLFGKAEVWGMYLTEITEERYHSAISLMLSTQNPLNILLYFRACYRMGFPAIDDKSYDVLQELYIMAYPNLTFLRGQSYDDDNYNPLVLQAIQISGVKNQGKRVKRSATIVDMEAHPEYAELNSEKSTSIRPVVKPEDAFNFWCNAPVCRVHFSLKIDGVNTKMLFSEEPDKGLVIALSRGRSADSIDYSDAIRLMFKQQNINDTMLAGKVTGESFVDLISMPTIQGHYPNKEYKTPKSTAMAMLRSPDKFIEEDFSMLSFYAFDYAGKPVDVAFAELQSAGFKTPPALEFDGSLIPRDSLESFNRWMDENVLDYMYMKSEEMGIGSDGVVMQLLADINTERKDQYSDSNIAIKYGYWSAATYIGTVTKIVFEQRRVEASIVLEIEPVVMRDKNTATRVGVGSPDILIRDGVRVGDRIEFERKSEAYNVYLRKRDS